MFPFISSSRRNVFLKRKSSVSEWKKFLWEDHLIQRLRVLGVDLGPGASTFFHQSFLRKYSDTISRKQILITSHQRPAILGSKFCFTRIAVQHTACELGRSVGTQTTRQYNLLRRWRLCSEGTRVYHILALFVILLGSLVSQSICIRSSWWKDPKSFVSVGLSIWSRLVRQSALVRSLVLVNLSIISFVVLYTSSYCVYHL